MPDSTLLLMSLGAGLLVMVAIFVLVFSLMNATQPEESPVKHRLRALREGDYGLASGDMDRLTEIRQAFFHLIEPMAQNLYGKNQGFLQTVKNLLTEAGMPDNDRAVWQFINLRVATSLSVGGGLFAVTLLLGAPFLFTLILLITGLLVGGMVPQFQLKMKAGKRKTEIRYNLPDTLDLMVVCVEAGLGLDATIQRVGEETERLCPDIAHEFKRVTKELNAGIPRTEAFTNMGSRSGVDELRSLCAMIVQADKLGTSIADTLRIYADDVRTKRRQKAEELASKASIKMTFPLVLFIFPPLFIILMGPMVITAMGTFFGK